MSDEREVTFVVKISTGDEIPNQETIDRLAHFAALHLNRGFGMDRLSLWHEGRRYVYDPGHDADHYGATTPSKWIERPETPVIASDAGL